MKTTIPILIGALWLAEPLFAASTIQFPARTYTVDEGAGQLTLPVVRLNDLDTVVSVEYFTVEGTATAGQDFTAASGILSFAAGVTNHTIHVPILNDALVELLERFQVMLTNATEGAVLSSMKVATISIRDNDTGPYFAASTYPVAEDVGSVLIQVNWVIVDTDESQTVDYVTLDETAVAGTDYEAANGTLVFEKGEQAKQIQVVILNDGVKDPDKTFRVQLSNATCGGLGAPSLATVIIQDPTPVIYLQPTPASQSVSLGANVKIQVSAKGARMQWQRRVGEGEFMDIPGANAPVLEWNFATADLSGEYRFMVSNWIGDSVTSETVAVDVDPSFTKITEGPHVTDLGTSGFGSWGDYDNDGYPDLSVNRGTLGTRALYRNNRDGTFSRLADPPGLTAALGVGHWDDWDNDGLMDLMLWNYTTTYVTWVAFNDGQGDFTPMGWSHNGNWWGCASADYDRDGLLDLYFTLPNRLYRNLGNRSFALITAEDAGTVASLNAWGGACWGDFDGDGWSDLYVPSLKESCSYLFRNLGAGRFERVDNLVTQTPAPAIAGAWGDYDNDGRLDLFVASFNGTSRLYRNLGNVEFEHPVGTPTLSGTHNFACWIDYDNDGFLDLWVSGYMSGNKLFRNLGDGTFIPVTRGSLVNERPLNHAGTYEAAWFDYDNDGFLDLYVMNGDDGTSISTANQLYHNNGNDHAWLTVRLVGTTSNRAAVGAKVHALAIYAGAARWQRRDISGGDLHNGNARYAHFGLGAATRVDKLRIDWPSGTIQELTDIPVHQILTVIEPPRDGEGVVYDAALDFSTAANPNGVWTYGYAAGLGGNLVAYTDRGNNSGLDYWRKNLWLGAPSVAYNPSTHTLDFGTPVYGPGQAGFHPGPNGEYSVFRFTAPGSGPYRLEAAFFGIDEAGTSTDVHVLWNDFPIFDGVVMGFGTNSGPHFNTNLVLQVGERIDFAVGFGNGSFFNDSTALDARLTWNSPQLFIRPVTAQRLEITWPGACTHYILESADLMPATEWLMVTNAVEVKGDKLAVPVELSTPQRYFRLRGR